MVEAEKIRLVASKLVDRGLVTFCAWKPDGERLHDLFDQSAFATNEKPVWGRSSLTGTIKNRWSTLYGSSSTQLALPRVLRNNVQTGLSLALKIRNGSRRFAQK
jgi:hypothetical protein